MRVNEHTTVSTFKITLVPYCAHHVPKYHDWMKDLDIQVATASEPLSLSEEYEMQRSWRFDKDKLTFILCLAHYDLGLSKRDTEIAAMIGDVNMFISEHEEEDGQLSLIGELELMIASKSAQRQGYGRAALLTFLKYVIQNQRVIVSEFSDRQEQAMQLEYYVVKIGKDNEGSIALFESTGFEKTSNTPNVFDEYELRHYQLTKEAIDSQMSKYGVSGYTETEYQYIET